LYFEVLHAFGEGSFKEQQEKNKRIVRV